MTRKPLTPALGSLHEIMSDLHSVGAISDAVMRQIDEGCLAPEEEPDASNLAKKDEKTQVAGASPYP